MADMYAEKESPGRLAQLERLNPQELLMLVGGVLAIAMGVLTFTLDYLSGKKILDLAFRFAIDLGFGFLLMVSYMVVKKNEINGAILGMTASIVLLVLGGNGGIIGGVPGLIGALIALGLALLESLKRE